MLSTEANSSWSRPPSSWGDRSARSAVCVARSVPAARPPSFIVWSPRRLVTPSRNRLPITRLYRSQQLVKRLQPALGFVVAGACRLGPFAVPVQFRISHQPAGIRQLLLGGGDLRCNFLERRPPGFRRVFPGAIPADPRGAPSLPSGPPGIMGPLCLHFIIRFMGIDETCTSRRQH